MNESISQRETAYHPSERRRFQRFEGDYEVILLDPPGKSSESIRGKALNISKEGMKLFMPTDIAVGDQLNLVVYYGGYDSICLGNVIWKQESTEGKTYGLHIKHWSYLDPPLEQLFSSEVKDKEHPHTAFFQTVDLPFAA